MQLSNDIMYEASFNKNPDFEDIFGMGVKTTGIFCRPTCTARKPKTENVEFFPTTKEAILKGYRPCKVCKPLENPNGTPEFIQEILKELQEDPTLKLKDSDLVHRTLEPITIRRWFQKNHGMTFQAFQRNIRLNTALKKIQQGDNIMGTVFDSGYESVSNFNDRFKNIFGISAKNSVLNSDGKKLQIIDLKRIETPIGAMYAAATNDGICMLEFADRKMLEAEFKDLAKSLNATIIQGENIHFETLEKELLEYFEGRRREFTVPLSPVGTEFQKSVWIVLAKIPFGETWTYRKQAEVLGDVKKVRAVANANGMNKISILLPCHRVIGSNGTLTGYGGGIWRKQKLLELEKAILF